MPAEPFIASGLLNPLLMAGAAAAGLPILIHLIHRKLAPDKPFPAIELLMRTQRQLMLHLRWKHWLLMALRALLVALIALALARPYLSTRALVASAAADQPPTAYVFVLDDTLSMRLRIGDEATLFGRCRELAVDALGDVRSFDQVALLSVSGTATWEVSSLGNDAGALARRLGEAEPGYRHATVWPALERARRVLAKSPLESKRIVIFSDMAETSWSAPVAHTRQMSALAGLGVGLRIIDCHPNQERSFNADNHALTLATADEEAGRIGLSVGCTRFAAGKTKRIFCRVSGQGIPAARNSAELAPGREASLSFSLTPRNRQIRWVSGRATLEEDGLPEDNVRFFALRRKRALRVLLVDGDPRETLELTETFYLSKALRTDPQARGGHIEASVITVNQLTQMPLEGYDCIVLANAAVLNAALQRRLLEAVEAGTGLLVALGSRTVPDWPAGPLDPIMPAVPVRMEVQEQQAAPVGLRIADAAHAVPGVLSPRWRLSLASVAVERFWRVEARPETANVISLTNGLPAWIEYTGKGPGGGRVRVMLSTIPLDRDWGNLAIHPTFVPLLQQAVRYLSAALGTSSAPEVLVGDTLRFSLPPEMGADTLTLELPTGAEAGLTPARRTDAGTEFHFGPAEHPGLYRLKSPAGNLLSVGVANIDPAESDTGAVRPDQVLDTVPRATRTALQARTGADVRARHLLSAPILWVCLGLLLLEGWYARR